MKGLDLIKPGKWVERHERKKFEKDERKLSNRLLLQSIEGLEQQATKGLEQALKRLEQLQFKRFEHHIIEAVDTIWATPTLAQIAAKETSMTTITIAAMNEELKRRGHYGSLIETDEDKAKAGLIIIQWTNNEGLARKTLNGPLSPFGDEWFTGK